RVPGPRENRNRWPGPTPKWQRCARIRTVPRPRHCERDVDHLPSSGSWCSVYIDARAWSRRSYYMSWWFGLAAECGTDEQAARALVVHFASPAETRCFKDFSGGWWCHVVPDGLSQSGIVSAGEPRAMTERGHELYARLREAPPVYRFALVGV